MRNKLYRHCRKNSDDGQKLENENRHLKKQNSNLVSGFQRASANADILPNGQRLGVKPADFDVVGVIALALVLNRIDHHRIQAKQETIDYLNSQLISISTNLNQK